MLAGAAVFAFSAWQGEAVDPESRRIAITRDRVATLTEGFVQNWRRSPTQGEIDGLIRDYIKEEVYYREALRIGLDADDPVVRRRLRSKMEFLATSAVEAETPDDATLSQWMARNPARYAAGARYSFDQIYLADTDPARAARLLAQARAGGDWQRLGDPLALPHSIEGADRTAIARDFGDGFADGVATLKPGTWQGPVASGFGQHLVRVRTVVPGRVPPLTDVRQAVENDWRAQTRAEREGKAYQTLLDGYTIVIEKP